MNISKIERWAPSDPDVVTLDYSFSSYFPTIQTTMPAQVVAQANPPPEASSLPDRLKDLAIVLKTPVLSDKDVQDLKAFRAAANYIAAGYS